MREYGDDTPDYFKCSKCGRVANDRHVRISLGTPCNATINEAEGRYCLGLFWPHMEVVSEVGKT